MKFMVKCESLDNIHEKTNCHHKNMYQAHVGAVYRHLEKEARVVIPLCIKFTIQDVFPDPEGIYMGHNEADVIFWNLN